jgi:hypothetical protein
MSQTNSIAVSIPDADLAEIRGAIGVLRAKLAPHLATISAQDRQELPKMGDKTLAFVQKAYEYGSRNPELAPAYLDFEAMEIDVRAVELLRELAQSLNPIHEALSDSLFLSGSEAYQGALLFYGSVKAAAKAKAPKAGSIYDDLSTRFPGAQQRKKDLK